jgi:F-type H+-transporting ATPase subunit epsilon
MADKLQFDLVAPEQRLFSGKVEMVVVPGTEGDFGVLPDHAPFMSTIRPGAISVHDENSVTRTFIYGGFAEVTPDGLTILAEEAIALADVDAVQIEKQLGEAREDLKDSSEEAEQADAQERIDKYEALLAALAN